MELLDLNLRIEDEFQISLEQGDWDSLFGQHTTRRGWIFQFDGEDATVSELCGTINKVLAKEG